MSSKHQSHYAILEVDPDATLETIKRAYRNKIRRHHPDQFVSQLTQAQTKGDIRTIQILQRQLDNAKRKTQDINAAYAILSDAESRAKYDQYLSDERQRQYYAEIRRNRMQHYEHGRRTVKSRPHHRNPNRRQVKQRDGVPWAIFAGLVLLMLFVSTLFTNAITRNHTPFTTYVPRNPTSSGSILAHELQATTNAEQATYQARTTIVFEATATPLPVAANESLGDRFMGLGQISSAINVYSDAIDADPQNAVLYVKRAVAYTALYDHDNGETEARDLAIADYTRALAFDTQFRDAYLGRGLLYYDLWLSRSTHAGEARADLLEYLALDGSAREVVHILEELP